MVRKLQKGCTAVVVVLLPAMALADLVIELVDGSRIAVPVDRGDVRSIEFVDGSAHASSNPPKEAAGAAGAKENAQLTGTTTWRVGPGRELKYPSQAARKAKDGDIVEIDAGVYPNNYAKWSQNNLTIRGVGGMAHLKSKGLISNGKAIWLLNGDNIVIENIEFSGAAVKATNGAGIRLQGGDVTIRNAFFHDNEFSIMGGKRPDANVEIVSSRFWFQKREKRYSHGIYIGRVGRLTLVGNHFKGTDGGHQVKSRALENRILYNRIEDVPQGNSSRLIDLSNCGLSYVIGNDLHQAKTSGNLTAIGYGKEGCDNRSEKQMQLFVINNTFVNEAKNGTLVDNRIGGEAIIANNLLIGKGKILVGSGTERNNVHAKLAERRDGGWGAPKGSTAINGAITLQDKEGFSLTPTQEFDPPYGTRRRQQSGRLDVGSREFRP